MRQGKMKAWLKAKASWAGIGAVGTFALAMPLVALSADVVSISGGPRSTVVKVIGLTNPAIVSASYKFSIALMPNCRLQTQIE